MWFTATGTSSSSWLATAGSANLPPKTKLKVSLIRADQSFVHGDDLKSDLKRLDQYYDGLPEETKAEGVYRFAAYPPHDDSYLVTRL
jgi:hypothetical protein